MSLFDKLEENILKDISRQEFEEQKRLEDNKKKIIDKIRQKINNIKKKSFSSFIDSILAGVFYTMTFGYKTAKFFKHRTLAARFEREIIDFYESYFHKERMEGIFLYKYFPYLKNYEKVKKLITVRPDFYPGKRKIGSMDYCRNSLTYNEVFEQTYNDIETREETDEEAQKRIEEFNNRKVNK